LSVFILFLFTADWANRRQDQADQAIPGEQQGLKDIEVGKSAFTTSGKIVLKNFADSVGDFVKRNPVTTAFILYAEMNGDLLRRRV